MGFYGNATIGNGVFEGLIDTENIANAAITADKIQNNTITNEKINDEAIISSKIASGAVNSSKLAAPSFAINDTEYTFLSYNNGNWHGYPFKINEKGQIGLNGEPVSIAIDIPEPSEITDITTDISAIQLQLTKMQSTDNLDVINLSSNSTRYPASSLMTTLLNNKINISDIISNSTITTSDYDTSLYQTKIPSVRTLYNTFSSIIGVASSAASINARLNQTEAEAQAASTLANSVNGQLNDLNGEINNIKGNLETGGSELTAKTVGSLLGLKLYKEEATGQEDVATYYLFNPGGGHTNAAPQIHDTVIKINANGVGFTTDYNGNNTNWATGVLTNGDAFFRSLASYHIDATNITSGTLSSSNVIPNTEIPAFRIDLNGGTIDIGDDSMHTTFTASKAQIGNPLIMQRKRQNSDGNTVIQPNTVLQLDAGILEMITGTAGSMLYFGLDADGIQSINNSANKTYDASQAILSLVSGPLTMPDPNDESADWVPSIWLTPLVGLYQSSGSIFTGDLFQHTGKNGTLGKIVGTSTTLISYGSNFDTDTHTLVANASLLEGFVRADIYETYTDNNQTTITNSGSSVTLSARNIYLTPLNSQGTVPSDLATQLSKILIGDANNNPTSLGSLLNNYIAKSFRTVDDFYRNIALNNIELSEKMHWYITRWGDGTEDFYGSINLNDSQKRTSGTTTYGLSFETSSYGQYFYSKEIRIYLPESSVSSVNKYVCHVNLSTTKNATREIHIGQISKSGNYISIWLAKNENTTDLFNDDNALRIDIIGKYSSIT